MSDLVPEIPPATVRHDLPSGGWVEMKDHTLLRAKTLKKVMRDAGLGSDDSALNVGLSITDTLAAILVTAWELPYDPEEADDGTVREWVLPSQDKTIVDELTAPDYSKLQGLVEPARTLLFPGKPDPSDVEDPASPTAPASA